MSAGEVRARNPAIAGLLSLLSPGLGQLYNGQPGLMALALVVCYGSALAATSGAIGALAMPDPSQGFGRVMLWGGMAVFAWIVSIVQAVFAALDRPEYELRGYNRAPVYLGILALFYLVLPFTLARPVTAWLMARNGIRTPEQVAAWTARVESLRRRAGASATDVPGAGQAELPVPDLEIQEPVDPEVAAAGAATVIHLVLVGGQDGGVYDMYSTEPSCVHQRGGAPSWANLYARPEDSLGVTAVQVQVNTDSGTTRDFRVSVNLGNLPGGRSYVADGATFEPGSVPPSATVDRRGAGAVLRLTGTTDRGVRIEATVQCRRISE